MRCRKVFVYGTLRIGGRFHSLIRGRVISAEEKILEGFAMFDDGRGYPLMVEGAPGDFVVGELLCLDDEDGLLFSILDELEDAGDDLPEEDRLYRRVEIELDGDRVWTYLYNLPIPEGASLIRDWMKEGKR